jgi:hypothetical protein
LAVAGGPPMCRRASRSMRLPTRISSSYYNRVVYLIH